MKSIQVVAAVIHRDGKILATQRGYGSKKGWWEFPGGKVEPGEQREAALRRELREEMAADLEVERFLMTIEYDYPEFHLTMHCYLCRLAADRYTLLEHSAARWLGQTQIAEVPWLPADIAVLDALPWGEL